MPARPRILVVCPTHHDYRELAPFAERYELVWHDYAAALEVMVAEDPPEGVVIGDPRAEIERILSLHPRGTIDAVISTDDYPGSLLATILSRRLGLPGVAPEADVACEDKFRSRVLQRSAVPIAVPDFALWEPGAPPPGIGYPLFLKPVKSFFSVGACRVNTEDDLRTLGPRAQLPDRFFEAFDVLAREYAGRGMSRPTVIAEALLAGSQHTLEGYVQGGAMHVIGVVDSIMFPGTISFQRFEYPSRLAAEVQERMRGIAERAMRALAFDGGMFNIELTYDAATGAIGIVEINPRMASQFADLYEKVDGWNSYEALLDVALGRAPAPRRREGRHAMAASCVLRTFEDRLVLDVPDDEDVARVQAAHPDMRIELFGVKGEWLSRQMQDGASYRYALFGIGGRDREEILGIFDEAARMLPFVFGDAVRTPDSFTSSVAVMR